MLPGLFARVRVPIGKPRKTLAVAETALGIDQGQSFLYVVNDSNAVEYRRVRVGLLDQGLRTIEEGIGPNDWVLVSGLQRVRPGATVAPERVAMPASGPAAVATRPYPVR
jgi:multidrug efflux pump subunit AcrA (membrane-fusion protein)